MRALTKPSRYCEPDYAPEWSPDGRRIVFMRGATIMLMDADGSHKRALHKTTGGFINIEVRPTWSPDGKRILFLDEVVKTTEEGKLVSGGFFIRTIRPDGTGLRTHFKSDPKRLVASPRWWPRGNLIAFSSKGTALEVIRLDGTGRRKLWVQPPSGGVRPRCLPSLSSAEAGWSSYPTGYDWSPDGRRLVFILKRTTYLLAPLQACVGDESWWQVWTVDLGGARRRIVSYESEGPDHWRYDRPSWSPDGKKLLLTRTRRFPDGNVPCCAGYVVITDAGGGEPTQIGPADDGCRITPTEQGIKPYPCLAQDAHWQPR